jgi:3-isopropylmalate/(R)-2-methylmalate dehydratase small subunit
MDDARARRQRNVTVDLEAQEIHGPDGGVVKFDIDPFKKHCLLNGLDDIGPRSSWTSRINTTSRLI